MMSSLAFAADAGAVAVVTFLAFLASALLVIATVVI